MQAYDHIENDPQFGGLSVNEGIVQPPTVNPYFFQQSHKKRVQYTAAEFVEGIRRGDRAMLGQAVTLVESTNPRHQAIAQEVIEKCLPFTGNSIRLGITGVPGAGKSTFIESLGMLLINENHRLAVLAIDPSSERSKGSILGDKTRMEQLSAQPASFIRPSPSAGSLGGVARKTRETIMLCEAAGFDTIIVETVGVGQSETAVHSMVDFFLFLQVAGTGDELQGIKRGIMEMVDGIAINKADGTNVERVNLTKAQLVNALHLFPLPLSGLTPQVLTCSALENMNISEVWKMVTDFIDHVRASGYFDYNRNNQAKYWMYETINEQLKTHFYTNAEIVSALQLYEQKVLNREISSFIAAKALLKAYFKKESV